ncbi:MAG: hypothetical protein [Caudoviricetes sp.]|nr:MAG: hypothetical protein [Caudoviricetes sp.]
MDTLVVSGSLSYLKHRYAHEFRSSKWKVIKVKEWSDGKYTYVFEYVGQE